MNDTSTALVTLTEEQALALTNEQALEYLARLDLTPPGTEDHVTADDIPRSARLRVAQNKITDLGIDAGSLYNNVTGTDYGNAVEAVFLAWKTDTRVMWPTEYNKDNDPECASDNGVTPSASSSRRKLTNPQAGPCSRCPSAQFGPNGEAPRCKRQRNCVLWVIEDQEPVQLTIQSAGMTPGKKLTELAEKCSVRRTIWITPKYEDNDKGQYYVLLYSKSGKDGTKITPQQMLQLHALAQYEAKMETLADTSREGNGYTPPPDAQVIEGDATERGSQGEVPGASGLDGSDEIPF